MKDITMDDYQFLDSFKKKRIQLTLRTATYAGTVERINLNKSVLLGDVVDVKSGRKFAGMKLFFGHEILNVELPNAPKPVEGNKEDHNHSNEGQLPVAEFQPYRKSIKLDGDDDDGEYVDFVVIDEFFEKFGPAVMDIRKQRVVGIGADGVGVSQHERLCWLQIASKTRVYLFDILMLGARAFKNGLSMILESNHILKVTHDCRSIAGSLWTQYGVNLCNVFDTQVADVMLFHAETGGFLPDRVSTLQEVVGLHLKMSPSCLASLRSEDSEVWYVRPCPVSLLKVMALSVIHLQALRMVLLDELMSDYMGRVDAYLAASREKPMNTQDIGTSSGLELPAGLRELESLRRGRRDWALARYPVAEDGLLVRSRPRPTPPTEEPGEGHAPLSWDTDPPEQPAPGEAGGGSPWASEEGPGDLTPFRTSLPSSPSARPAGSLEATPIPGKAAPGEAAPAPAAGGTRPLEITVEGVTGRGRQPQWGVGMPAATAYPPAGRGLCLQIPPLVSRELPGAAGPQPMGRAADASQSPPLSQQGPLAVAGGLGGAPPLGAVLPATGTMPENIVSLGRGLFFQKPPQIPSSQFKLSSSSFRKTCQ
ncbi:piRNA biogenesis protein EXD1 [Anguilla rostrata]|uniref:piRNA biogenesis protein EXD1 n=1 Tax=Anguilla rostrata TaxID=7938 RepID=UPI0030CB6C0E